MNLIFLNWLVLSKHVFGINRMFGSRKMAVCFACPLHKRAISISCTIWLGDTTCIYGLGVLFKVLTSFLLNNVFIFNHVTQPEPENVHEYMIL